MGLHIDFAQASGEHVSGLTVDWSKCYDRLPLDTLAAVAQAAGVPSEIWQPMLAAYRLPRLIRADGLAGPARSPCCGLAPGCPAATDWLALVMHYWTLRLREVAPALIERAYADDLSAFTGLRGTLADVGTAWKVTVAFGRAFGLVLNQAKSVRYATAAADRAALARTPGPPVCTSFRDLGVAQRVAARHGPVLPGGRMRAADSRLDRCGSLCLPFPALCRVVASAAVSSMMFGAGQVLLPRRTSRADGAGYTPSSRRAASARPPMRMPCSSSSLGG